MNKQNQLADGINALSPEKRAVLERKMDQRLANRIPKRSPHVPTSLSFAQQRLWFLEQLEPGAATYNVARSIHLSGALQVAPLERALAQLVSRHEVLRTTFELQHGEPVQVVHASIEVLVPVVDLRGLDEAQRTRQVSRWSEEEACGGFDLTRGPLLRVRLLRLGDERWVLLLTLHHIVCDGWSMGVLFRELGALYEAALRGGSAELEALPIQYADYALWQRDWMSGEVLEREVSYWREQLGGSLPVLELLGDRARPAVQSHRGAAISFQLSAGLSEGLRGLARAEGVTLYMVLLSGFKALLHRYTGQTDLLVGSPIANRTRVEVEGLIGFFVNTLVLRTEVEGGMSFRELLSRVRAVALGAYSHQELPFEKLVEVLEPQRSRAHAPLFQTLFALQNMPRSPLTLPGIETRDWRRRNASAQRKMFDLSVFVFDDADDVLRGRIEFNTDIFDAATVERMAGHFERLLGGAVSQPTLRLSQLPLLSDAEREQVLVDWNTTARGYPRDGSLSALFEAQVLRTPHAVALWCAGEGVSYEALNARANRLAHWLRAEGVGAETPVGLCLGRGVELVVAMLAVLKAGGAYVPLDPSYPLARIEFMLGDVGAQWVLTEQRLREVLPLGHGVQAVCLDTMAPELACQAQHNLDVVVAPEQLAYIIYTSGSTGQPKGVAVPHRGVINVLSAMAQTPGLEASDTLLAVTSLSFDIAALELLLPLIVGARLAIAPSAVTRDGAQLAALMKKVSATVMQATPATWRMLLAARWQGRSTLKVLCGGEALPVKLANELLNHSAGVWNLYGPTEATIWSLMHKVRSGESPVPIGRPICNTEVYVLDESGSPVPVGVAGELFLGGDGVARDYHNRPELTAMQFVPHPFNDNAGARLYRTGDRVRYRRDGVLEFLGRTDQQVKLRGYRIELGDVEAAISTHRDVRAAVARVDTTPAGDQRLVAFVLLGSESALPETVLRDHLRNQLPEHMVPSVIVWLDTLPLTPNGKLDRNALPTLPSERPQLARGYVEPSTHNQRRVASVWANVLELERVGVHDDFFDLGGHSLMAVRLVANLDNELNLRVPVAALFQGATIAELAAKMDAGARALAQSATVAIRAAGSRWPLFAGGSHPRYLDVARAMHCDQPFYRLDVYALQSRRLHDGCELYTRVEDIAAHFVDDIRQVQPTGPYRFGGGCEGALVAFEIANQLQSQGECIDRLMLWLAPVPGHSKVFARSSASRVAAQLRTMLARASWRDLRPANIAQVIRHEVIEYRIFQAMNSYRPSRMFDGQLVLVHTEADRARVNLANGAGWASFATAGVEVCFVPGSHETCLQFHAHDLGEMLQSKLSEPR